MSSVMSEAALSVLQADPAIIRQQSIPRLEKDLGQTNDSKLNVKELRRYISAMRDLDFQQDTREKIPEKWSVRPSYLSEDVKFFDPQNGPKIEGNKRGPKPTKATLLPLFLTMRDHHFPDIGTKKAAFQMNNFNLRARDDASSNARVGLVKDISQPKHTLDQSASDCTSVDKQQLTMDNTSGKPSLENFYVERQLSNPLIPTVVEEQEPVDITLPMDQNSIVEMNETDLLQNIMSGCYLPPVPHTLSTEDFDVAMEQEVSTTEMPSNILEKWSVNRYEDLSCMAPIKTEAPSPALVVDDTMDPYGGEYQMILDVSSMNIVLEEPNEQTAEEISRYWV